MRYMLLLALFLSVLSTRTQSQSISVSPTAAKKLGSSTLHLQTHLQAASENPNTKLAVSLRSAGKSFSNAELGELRLRLAQLGGSVETVLGNVATVRLAPEQLDALAGLAFIRRIEFNLPDEPLDMNLSRSNTQLGGLWLGTNTDSAQALGYTGKSTLVAVIDDGFDIYNGDFLDANGRTRIVYLWNQNAAGTPPVAPSYSYGAEYDSAMINGGISVPNSFHGTSCLGIAAGDGSQSGFRGMAPDANLIVVVRSLVSSSNIVDAFNYIAQKAKAMQKPVSVSYSFGGQYGGHDGSRDTEITQDTLSTGGVFFSIAAGNSRSSPVHIEGSVPLAGNDNVSFSNGSGAGFHAMNLWYGGADSVDVFFISPASNVYGPFTKGTLQILPTPDGEVAVYNDFYSENGATEIDCYVKNATAGNWTLRLFGRHITGSGGYDGWTYQAQGGGGWNDHITFTKNVTTPSTADSGAGVAAFDVNSGNLDGGSSKGFSRTGAVKPNLAAPTNVGSTAGVFGGTSAAAPHSAGAAAVLLQANPKLSASQILSALQDSARTDAATGGVPNSDWGYGKLHTLASLQRVLPQSPSTVAVSHTGNYVYGEDDRYGAILNFASESMDSVKVEFFPNTIPPNLGSSKAVQRYAALTSFGGSFNATLRLYYTDAEVSAGGLIENNLKLYRLNGTVWELQGGTMNGAENYVELSGITAFSSWAIGDPNDSPLPVEFLGLSALATGGAITLSWRTLSEANNLGFTLERQGRQGSGENFASIADHTTATGLRSQGNGGGTYTYIDASVSTGTYFYRLSSRDESGVRHDLQTVEVSVRASAGSDKPEAYRLYPNYPNPFNPQTQVRFDLKETAFVTLRLFDVLGREVRVLMREEKPAGTHQVRLSGEALPSGVYFYSLQAAGRNGELFSATRKMVLMK